MEKLPPKISPTLQGRDDLFTAYREALHTELGKKLALVFASAGLAHLLGADYLLDISHTMDEYKDLPADYFACIALIMKLKSCVADITENKVTRSAFNDSNDDRVKVYLSNFAPSRHIVDVFQTSTCMLILNTDLDDGSTQAIAFDSKKDNLVLSDLAWPKRQGEVYAVNLLHTPQEQGELLADAVLKRLQAEDGDPDFACERFIGV